MASLNYYRMFWNYIKLLVKKDKTLGGTADDCDSDQLPQVAVTRIRGPEKMTPNEAEEILDVVSAALQTEAPIGLKRVSLLRGYDISQIDTAMKLRTARLFLETSADPGPESEPVRVCERVQTPLVRR